MAQCGTCHHMEEEIIAVRNGVKGPMMREVTLRCSVTILAQKVSPVSGVYDRHRFGADLLFLFLWRIVRCLSTRSMANVYAHAVRLPSNKCVEASRLLSVDQWNV